MLNYYMEYLSPSEMMNPFEFSPVPMPAPVMDPYMVMSSDKFAAKRNCLRFGKCYRIITVSFGNNCFCNVLMS